jgi:hypothetical protein
MSLLAVRVGAVILALLAFIALRGKRWAYLAFVVLGLLYFPAQTHFRVHAPKCQQVIPTMNVVVLSLQRYALIALFAGFCWMSWVQLRQSKARFVWAVLATVLVGALVEIAEGMTGRGLCRVRDLVPAAAGAVVAALVLELWSRLFRKPGYVAVRRPHSAAPRKPVAPARPAAPLRGIPTLPVSPRAVPPPPDFSPPDFGERAPTPAAPPADVTPTEEVAQSQERVTQPEIVQRLRAILQRFSQRFLAMLQWLWAVIRARRRTIVVGVILLVLVGAAAVVILVVLPAPAPTVVEQPKAPPPPPPRPLQSEAGGYYEPGYQFTVADRRFTRLTLRPETFLTFARPGTREEAGCADARIGRDAVYLRCELYRVGMVTIDGRFNSRVVTGRLDMPALSALITVTNPRGEVLYRARDSFRWHGPD